ncbi:site-specific integrase [Agrobacterium salinitolerans]|uniref:Site-specific integrase n=1 Tax=Agrobacterium salinitolerans TaxID=1183413 RepID=A0ABY3BRW0_9HYPH|nr:site-specific integrase [Agrobacterium salinitolerans]
MASYLADHGKTHAVSTLRRWVASLSKAHSSAGHPDPTRLEPARSTLRGICRSRKERTSCAMPLLKDDLFAVLGAIGNTVRDRRDRSLLLVGFAAGFRRSELTGLDVEDVNFVRRGMIITLRRSKTDQTNLGRDIAIPFGKSQYCPVRELEEWLATAEISSGPLYRSVRRNGSISEKRLSAEAVSGIIKQRVAACGYDPKKFSGHSLRSGFATSAAQAGVSSWKIREQTGHRSDAMLARYIRSVELFVGNASGAIL